MSKAKIYGNPNPMIGIKEYYSIHDFFGSSAPSKFMEPLENIPDENIKWSVWILLGNEWVKMTKNNKTGATVDYTFTQTSITRKGIRMLVEANGEKAVLDIKTKKNVESKILHIEILDNLGKKPTKLFSYGETITARVHCLNMEKFRINVTLWENDGGKKDLSDISIETKETNVLKGIADVKFTFDTSKVWLANAKTASRESNEGAFHEYYVTAEFYKKVSKPTQDINVINPDYKVDILSKTSASKPSEKETKKPSPREQKGPSKKETRGIAKADRKAHDYQEQKVDVQPTTIYNPQQEFINSLLMVNVGDSIWNQNKCVCKDYDLVWGGHPNVSCDFRKKVVEISKRQNFDPNHLMAVMWAETSHTFSTSKVELKPTGKLRDNGKPQVDYKGLTKEEILKLSENFDGAVGLIQFTPAAINGLNRNYGYSLTKRKLSLMSQLEQLFYVEQYIAFWKKANKIQSKLTLADLYLLVFAPAKMNGSNDNTTLYKEGTEFYNANASIDTDLENGITKKELAKRAYDSFNDGSKKENKASILICQESKSSEGNIKATGFYVYKNGDIKYIKSGDQIDYYVQVKDGSNDFKKIETLTKNIYGLVKFPDSGSGFGRYGGEDTGGQSTFEDVGQGDHFLLPETSAALFGLISHIAEKKWQIDFGDMSSENGSDPTSNPSNRSTHHAGHGHRGKQSGLNVDFRYLNKDGKSFQGVSSSSVFDDNKNEELFKIAYSYGFNKNYATGKTYFGVNPAVLKHYDHGHFGSLAINYETVEEINAKIIK